MSERNQLEAKAAEYFPGYIVRKDLVQQVKGNAVVPTYVLEFLLAQYCASTNEAEIAAGVESVRKILAKHYVNRGESELIKSRIREQRGYRIIDKVSVSLDERKDRYVAAFENLGVRDALVSDQTVQGNDRLLTGGVWCMADITYTADVAVGGKPKEGPWTVTNLNAIQLPFFDRDGYVAAREQFDTAEWIDLLIASIGFNPEKLSRRAKLLQLTRLIPYVERNYNLVELGPKGTGKSHIYSELSPHGMLVSGGEVTLAKLFINNTTRQIGLVGFWDVVAFDEFAGKKKVKQNLVDTMKNYLANKSFSRGDSPVTAEASMVFVGNTSNTVPAMLANSDLFESLPEAYHDTAYMDRIHYYIPGWEVDVIRPELFNRGYGFVVDYLAEALRAFRAEDYSGRFAQYFDLDKEMSTRDRDAVRKTFSGLMKLVHPSGQASEHEVEDLLRYAIEGRRRVKEQILRLDATMRESGLHFSYAPASGGNPREVVTQEELDYPELFGRDAQDGLAEAASGEAASGERAKPAAAESAKVAATGPAKVEGAGPASCAGSAGNGGSGKQAAAGPRERRLEVPENKLGVSLQRLLVDYLVGAAKVEIVDPYVRMPYQVENLYEVLATILAVKPRGETVDVKLLTGCDREHLEWVDNQRDMLEQLQNNFAKYGLNFSFEIGKAGHDRKITTDTGWSIDLGRGLDIYQPWTSDGAFDPRRRVTHYRRTKAFTFTASRQEREN